MQETKILEFRLRNKNSRRTAEKEVSNKERFYAYVKEMGITETEDIVEIMTQFSVKSFMIFQMGFVEFMREMSKVALFSEEADEDEEGLEDGEDDEDEEEDGIDFGFEIPFAREEASEDGFWTEDEEDWDEEDEYDDEDEDDEDGGSPFSFAREDMEGLFGMMKLLKHAEEIYEHFGGEEPNIYDFIMYELDNYEGEY